MSKGKVKTKLKDPLQGTAISRKFQNQIPNSFATRSKNPKAKPNWGIIPARPQLGISFYSTLFYVTLLYFSLIDFALLCFVLLALLYFTCLLLYLTASALTRQLGAKVKAMAKLKHN